MGADAHAMAPRRLDRLVHDHGVAGVEAARDGAGRDVRHDGVVVSLWPTVLALASWPVPAATGPHHGPVAERFTHVAVNLHGLGRPLQRRLGHGVGLAESRAVCAVSTLQRVCVLSFLSQRDELKSASASLGLVG